MLYNIFTPSQHATQEYNIFILLFISPTTETGSTYQNDKEGKAN